MGALWKLILLYMCCVISCVKGNNEIIPKQFGGKKLSLSDLMKKSAVEGSYADSDVHGKTHHPPGHSHGTTHHPPGHSHGTTHHPPGHSHPPGHGSTHHPPGHSHAPGGTHPPGHGGGHDMKKWHTMTQGHMAGSCIGLAVIAILYEGFKVLREYIMFVAVRRNTVGEKGSIVSARKGLWIGSGWHILQSFLHVIQCFISYCLMLVFMTYNAWLCISVLLGMMFGYFFFGWMKYNNGSDSNEHCS